MNNPLNTDLNNMPIPDLWLLSLQDKYDKNHGYSQKDIFSALHSRLHAMSVYELLRTFLLTKYTDFFDQKEIFAVLREKSGQHIDDHVDLWVAWFLDLPLDSLDKLGNDIDTINTLKSHLGNNTERAYIALSYIGYKSDREFTKNRKNLPVSEREAEVQKIYSEITALETAGNTEGALALADEFIKKHPDSSTAWAMRSAVHMRSNDYTKAILDITHAIQIKPTPPLFISRGQLYYKNGNYELAVSDFSKLLELKYFPHPFYEELFHLWRAEAHLRLGKKPEALSDITYLSDKKYMLSDKVRTKAELLAECNKLSD